MAYQARVFRVLIASPSDVNPERDLVVQCIQEWNDLNSHQRKVVLLPLRWETHSRPEVGRRPQEIINTTVVDGCDVLIGIFWTRMGTEAGSGQTGTVEEIERTLSAGKPVMLYFSKAKIEPHLIDLDQFTKLKQFQEQTTAQALFESYDNLIEFKDKVSRHLERKVRELISTSEDSAPESQSHIAALDLKFYNAEEKSSCGPSIELNSLFIDPQIAVDLPDYVEEKENKSDSKGTLLGGFWEEQANKNYYRETALRAFQTNSLRPIQFSLQNTGIIGIRDIYVEIYLESDKPFFFIEPSMILRPVSKKNTFGMTNSDYDMDRIRTQSPRWSTNFNIAALQPKRTISSPIIGFVGASIPTQISVKSVMFGDCFSEPRRENLSISFKPTQSGFSRDALLKALNEP
jgi:hypothetical protein